MQTSTPIIDIHSHYTLMTYGNSFNRSNNAEIYGDDVCIWTPDNYSEIDKAFENTIGISRYRQADCETLLKGRVKIVSTSLYPQEIGFVETKQYLQTGIGMMITLSFLKTHPMGIMLKILFIK